jgi:hypothetical protein
MCNFATYNKLTFSSFSLPVFNQISSQLPRTAFNFHKPAHGYADDDDVMAHLPCRILSDWFICKKSTAYSRSHFPRKRTALPRQGNHLDKYVLYGTIKPNHPQQEPLKVELTNLVHYTIDHSREFRGYWVATPEANYWLQQPCIQRRLVDSCTITVGMTHEGMRGEFPRYQIDLPSQQDLHVFHRAQLGLFSNLVDLMFPPIATAAAAAAANTIAGEYDDSRDFYLHYFTKQTPQEIFDELSPSPDLMKFHQEKMKRQDPSEPLTPLHEHPFDLSLLSSPCSMEFLYPHIRHLHTSQLHESTFLKALEGNVKPIDDEYDTDYESQAPSYLLSTSSEETYWRQSAEEAERRSQQTPWGQPIPGSQQPPNLVSPMELGLEYIVSKLGAPDSSNGDARQGSSSVLSDTTLLPTTVLSNQQTLNVENAQPAQCKGDDLDMQPILSNPSSKRQRVEGHDLFLSDSGCESDVHDRRQRLKVTHLHEKVTSNNVVTTDASEGEGDESGPRNSSKNRKKAMIAKDRSAPEKPRRYPTLSTSEKERQDLESALAIDHRHIVEVSEQHSTVRNPDSRIEEPKMQLSSEPTGGFEVIERVSKSQVTDEPHNLLGPDKGSLELPKDRFHQTQDERQMNSDARIARIISETARIIPETETLQSHPQDRKIPSSNYEERTRNDFEKRDHNNDDSDFHWPTVDANRSNDHEERRRQPCSNNSERSWRDPGQRRHWRRHQREEREYSAAAHVDRSRSNRRRESESGSYTLSLDHQKRNTSKPTHQPQPQPREVSREERQSRHPSTHRDGSFSRNHSLDPPSSSQRHQQNPALARGFKNEPIPGDERELGPDQGYHPRFDSERRPRPPMSRPIRDYHENFEHPPKQIDFERRPSRHIRNYHQEFQQPPRSRTELPHRYNAGFRDYQSLDRGRRDPWHQCDNRGYFEPRSCSSHSFARGPSVPQRDETRGIAKKLDPDMIGSEETRVERRVSVEHHHQDHQNTRRHNDRQTNPSLRDSRPGSFRPMDRGSRDPRGSNEQGHRSTRNASDARSHRPYGVHGDACRR